MDDMKPLKKPGTPKGVKLPPILKKAPKKPAKKVVRKAKPKKTAAERTALAEAAKQRGKAIRKHDWDGMRERYIAEPTMSIKRLAEEMGIPYDQARIRSSKERWTYQRAQEQARLFKKKREDHLIKLADDSIKFDQVAIDTAKVGMSLVAGRLAEMSRLFAASAPGTAAVLEKLQSGQPVTLQEMRSTINYKELSELARAALTFQEIGRKAFGTENGTLDIENLTINNNGNNEQTINVSAELGKDDPARLASFLEALERTGLTNLALDDANVLEGVVVEDIKEIESGNPVRLDGRPAASGEGEAESDVRDVPVVEG